MLTHKFPEKRIIPSSTQDLQAINMRRLQETNLEIIAHLKEVEEKAQVLDRENSAARKIIWAAAHSNGGRLEISDDSMRAAADHNNEIASYYDPENQVTVFKANNKDKKVRGD